MSVDNEINNFPLSPNGCWHNGVHIINEKNIQSKFLASLCAVRNSVYPIEKYKQLAELITVDDYCLLNDEEKSMYEADNEGSVYVLKKNTINSIVQNILKKLNLYISQDFTLFQYNYYNNNRKYKLKFFSLYIHLDNILNTKKENNIKYYDENNKLIVFPQTTFATAETLREDDYFYQLEYFMDKNHSKDFFGNKNLFLPANECFEIDGTVKLFFLQNSNEKTEKLHYLTNTIFEILDFPDEESYPNIVKVKPYFLPCEIYRDGNTLQFKKDVSFKLCLDLFNLLDWKRKEKIFYLKEKSFIKDYQIDNKLKYGYIRIDTINGVNYQKDINLDNLICHTDYSWVPEDIYLINNHALNVDTREFYILLDNYSLKEVYFDDKRMLYLRSNSEQAYVELEVFDYNPCLYNKAFSKEINIEKKRISSNKIYFKNSDIKYDIEKKVYIKYSDQQYYCLDKKNKTAFVSQCDYFTQVTEEDLKDINEESDGEFRKEKLIKVFEEKNKSNNNSYKYGAFEHPSEWNKDEFFSKMIGFKQQYIKNNIAIWDEKYLNKSLCKEIQNCKNFTFFYKSQFENFLTDLHKSYADKLIKIQDEVMHKYSYKQGNLGLYKNTFGFKSDDKQTFCNHAVFETIIKVDGNFGNFTDKTSSEKNSSRNPLLEKFPECPKPKEYEYRASNYWCDVLKKQSENSSKTGIYNITPEQAFYMARLGYVVIACWKNTLKKNEKGENHSPHFVTIRPSFRNYKSFNSLIVAHVGGGVNEVKSLVNAFSVLDDDKKKQEIYFYCNIQQCFI